MATDDTPDELPPTSMPESIVVEIRDWADNVSAQKLGELLLLCLRELSRCIDLSNLDGLTIGGDYPKALAELDRGYDATVLLKPSNNVAIGIAMTPSVIRDGQLKSHIVLNAGLAAALLDMEHEYFSLAFHTLAHECAHVQITAAFDRCFPKVLLRSNHADLQEQCRWDVILACWDEYAATRISAGFGKDPTEYYEETFIESLNTARENANNAIRSYRLHADHGRILREVYLEYGRLMKYAAYLLGDLDARRVEIEDRALSAAALDGNPFQPVLQRLRDALRKLYENFGTWTDEKLFEVIGDIVDELVAEGGVYITKARPGFVDIRVPFNPQTSSF